MLNIQWQRLKSPVPDRCKAKKSVPAISLHQHIFCICRSEDSGKDIRTGHHPYTDIPLQHRLDTTEPERHSLLEPHL